MLAHGAVLRVHGHATESEDRVRQALALFAGEAEPTRGLAEGVYGNPIVVLEAKLDKRAAQAMWERLRSHAELAERLRTEAARRIDERCQFFARFDKQRAFHGQAELTASDDAVHLRSKIATFPTRQELAIRAVQDFLGAGPSEAAPEASSPKP